MDLCELFEGESLPEKLILAINEEDFEEIKALTQKIDITNVRASNNDTLIHIAVRKKNLQILEFLLNLEKINVDAFNSLGKTALLMSVHLALPGMTQLLIQKRVNVNLRDLQGGNTPLHYATYCNFKNECLLLLQNGADVNVQNNMGDTPLHIVVEWQPDLELAAMLMYYGADPTIFSYNESSLGYTPFDLSLVHHRVEFQELLVDYVINGLTKMDFALAAIGGAMENECRLFPLIMEKVSEIIFDNQELLRFLQRIVFYKIEYLRIFLNRFHYVIHGIRHLKGNLTQSLFQLFRNLPHFDGDIYCVIENLFLIFSDPSMPYFVESVNRKLNENILVAIEKIFYSKNISLDLLTKLLLHLLSCGVVMTNELLSDVYFQWGDCFLFRTLLHMDICSFYLDRPIPTIMFDVSIRDVDYFFQNYRTKDMKFLKVMEYFTSCKIRELCYRINDPELVEKMEKTPKVPFLLELARNKARNYLIDFYKIQNSRQYYTVLKFLPICEAYKEILSFRRKLY